MAPEPNLAVDKASSAALVLAGRGSYDALARPEQIVVRRVWEDRIEASRLALDFAAEYRARGRSWSEADINGSVVIRS